MQIAYVFDILDDFDGLKPLTTMLFVSLEAAAGMHEDLEAGRVDGYHYSTSAIRVSPIMPVGNC